MKQILIGIQDLLDQPNPADPAQTEGYHLFIQVTMILLIAETIAFYVKPSCEMCTPEWERSIQLHHRS